VTTFPAAVAKNEELHRYPLSNHPDQRARERVIGSGMIVLAATFTSILMAE
jgi:hypothetical protein